MPAATIPVPQEPYDVIVVGGSYAGLSAALTLYRALHTCLIFDSGEPRNALATKTRLTSGWEGEDPHKVQEATRNEVLSSGLVHLVPRAVTTARKISDSKFEVVDTEGQTWAGRKILLAIGVQEIYPDIEGYAENYPSSIYHCMFCFGYEQQGSQFAGLLAVGTLANAAHALVNAQDAHKFADTVIIFTNGNSSLMTELAAKVPKGIHVDDRHIKHLTKRQDGGGIDMEFVDGDQINLAFMVHKPDLKVHPALPEQLGVECVPGLGIKVTPPFNKTSVDGVFAAGDCCSPLRMIPNAMTMGSFAGCGIARELPKTSIETRN